MLSFEIKIALNFILSHMYEKLPRRRVNLFGEELEKYLKYKLTSSAAPAANSSQSAPTVSGIFLSSLNNEAQTSRIFYVNKQELLIDPSLLAACNDSALDVKEVLACLPAYLKLYIEPGLVGYTLEPCLTETQFEKQFKILHSASASDDGLNNSSDVNNNSLDYASLVASQNNLNENILKLLSTSGSGGAPFSDPQSLQYLLSKLTMGEDLSAGLKRSLADSNTCKANVNSNLFLDRNVLSPLNSSSSNNG
jgi:hypothetical protein